MVKCPNCGSTAQIWISDHETYVWKNKISVYLIYECGCGCEFATRVETDRSNEKFYEIIEKRG